MKWQLLSERCLRCLLEAAAAAAAHASYLTAFTRPSCHTHTACSLSWLNGSPSWLAVNLFTWPKFNSPAPVGFIFLFFCCHNHRRVFSLSFRRVLSVINCMQQLLLRVIWRGAGKGVTAKGVTHALTNSSHALDNDNDNWKIVCLHVRTHFCAFFKRFAADLYEKATTTKTIVKNNNNNGKNRVKKANHWQSNCLK